MPTLWISSFITQAKKIDLFEALVLGAKKHGYIVNQHQPTLATISKKDIYCCWNRHQDQDYLASLFDSIGAKVLIFENPYFKITKQRDYKYYSLSHRVPNTPVGSIPCLDDGQRFKSFNQKVLDWKKDKDGPILIGSQSKRYDRRSIGYHVNAQPDHWDSLICKRLASRYPERDLYLRLHPNHTNGSPETWHWYDAIPRLHRTFGKTLEECLSLASTTVVHSSNLATDSLLAGVPVIYTGEHIFAMNYCSTDFDNPIFPNRTKLFNHMAWNQFNTQEIMKGKLFELIHYAEDQPKPNDQGPV